ncbi:MAG: DUF2452 domain-containing protein [Bacteroidota bacterium]
MNNKSKSAGKTPSTENAPRAEESPGFVNPIDPDKVAENPHLLPYAHSVGGAVIKPIDKGRVKGLALEAMYEQTNTQLDQIREQVELLARQAQAIHDRVQLSEKIYQAEMNFKPLIGKTYHLYQKGERYILSMIAPAEWGASLPYEFLSSARLLSDHTWEMLEAEA